MSKKFKYLKQKIKLPNGVVTTVHIIDYPPAVLMIPFLSKDKIVFIRQYRPVFKKYLYELPAGTLNKGETLSACAKRELMEEAGYACQRLKKLGQVFPAPGSSNEIIHIYRADQLTPFKIKGDVDEIIQPVILTRPQVQKLFRQGKINDAKTIGALAMCGWI